MVLVRRSLSTLGEMLAMPDLKKEELADQVPPHATNQLCSNERRLGVPSNHYIDNGEGSLRKISRSRSILVSSPTFDSLHIDGGCSDKECATPKEEVKPKNGKSSLKGKI
uniref:Uncharacterized protein n=1 Tax=Arundo donax TaxID=35708 RepID=A0A0A9D908_ARUDO